MSNSTPLEPSLRAIVDAPDYALRIRGLLNQIDAVSEVADMVVLLRETAVAIGADAAVFTSFIRDDATLASFRSLLACDAAWGTLYAKNGWCAHDPWLAHAASHSHPLRGSKLRIDTAEQQHVVDAAAAYGFASTLVAPAPSALAQSRVGVLVLGSATPEFFEGDGYAAVKMEARSLAMEVDEWWSRWIKTDLMRSAHITEDDLALLRLQQQGLSSKGIAAALGVGAPAIDCRIQRLNIRLGAQNRRAATRLAEIYGLIDPLPTRNSTGL